MSVWGYADERYIRMIALLGLAAGAAHVFSGPDHWVAVAPLSVSRPRDAMTFGARWGIGHGAGVIAMGLCGIWLRDAFALQAVSEVAEIAVGVILIITGVWAVRRAKLIVVHSHRHQHGSDMHGHMHVHMPYDESTHSHDHGKCTRRTALITARHRCSAISGPPALALDLPQVVTYLLAFVCASTLSMVCVSMGIGRLLRSKNDAFMPSALRWTGVFSCVVGGVWCAYSLA